MGSKLFSRIKIAWPEANVICFTSRAVESESEIEGFRPGARRAFLNGITFRAENVQFGTHTLDIRGVLQHVYFLLADTQTCGGAFRVGTLWCTELCPPTTFEVYPERTITVSHMFALGEFLLGSSPRTFIGQVKAVGTEEAGRGKGAPERKVWQAFGKIQ